MQVILHEGDQTRRMHLLNADIPQSKIIVPVKVFTGMENKWAGPIAYDRNLIYQFIFNDGTYNHYLLIKTEDLVV